MCGVMMSDRILVMLNVKINNQEVFTAFDVTKAIRKEIEDRNESDKVAHGDTRNIVTNEFVTGEMSGYNRELRTLNVPGDPEAFVYYPDGKSADDHEKVGSIAIFSTPVNPPADNDSNMTKGSRLEIPQTVLAQVSVVGGSYDICINGTNIYVKPDKTGRVRLSKTSCGGIGKFEITVDNNVITIQSL